MTENTKQNTSTLHRKFITLLLLACLSVGCEIKLPTDQPKKSTNTKYTDDLGVTLSLPNKRGKILALCPSVTEILFAVCPDSLICGVTDVCNFPPEALTKPKIKVYPLDLEGILALKPGLVITENGMTSPENAEKIRSMGIPVYYQCYNTVNDVIDRIRDVGSLTRCTEKANSLADSLENQKDILEKEQPNTNRPSILAITWTAPIYAYGFNTLMTDKIRIAGGKNALSAKMQKQYPELTREFILKLNPDIILGGSFDELNRTFFSQYPELKQLNAYKNRRVYALTDDLATRPSPRVIESIKEIKAIILKSGI